MRRHLNKALWFFVHKVPWKPILIWGPWALILLVILGYQVENWRGARALKKAHQLAAKQGVSLDWRDYVPPPIPKSENLLYAAPLVDGRIESYKSLRYGGVAGISTDRKAFRERNAKFLAQSLELKKWLPPASRPTTEKEAAQELDLILADRKAALEELCALLPTHQLALPFDASALGSTERDPTGLFLGHGNKLAETCTADSLIAIALEDSERALARIDLMQAYAESQNYPCILALLLKANYLAAIDEIVWNIVKAKALTPEQCQQLHLRLSTLSLSKDIPRTIGGELAFANLGAQILKENRDLLTHDPTAALTGTLFGSGPTGFEKLLSDTRDFFYRRMPGGWIDLWHAYEIKALLEISAGLDFQTPDHFLTFQKRSQAESQKKQGAPISLYDNLATWDNIMTGSQHIEATHKLALIGLELELFNHQNGHYPATLAELEKAATRTLPLDPFTAKPFHYRLKKDNTPLAWSPGKNLVDEGGLPQRTKEEGDIVWMLTPLSNLTERVWQRQLRKHSGNFSRGK